MEMMDRVVGIEESLLIVLLLECRVENLLTQLPFLHGESDVNENTQMAWNLRTQSLHLQRLLVESYYSRADAQCELTGFAEKRWPWKLAKDEYYIVVCKKVAHAYCSEMTNVHSFCKALHNLPRTHLLPLRNSCKSIHGSIMLDTLWILSSHSFGQIVNISVLVGCVEV